MPRMLLFVLCLALAGALLWFKGFETAPLPAPLRPVAGDCSCFDVSSMPTCSTASAALAVG